MKKVRSISFPLTEEGKIYDEIESLAKELGWGVSTLMREAMREWLPIVRARYAERLGKRGAK